MVKIEARTQKERDVDKKLETLLRVAKGIFGEDTHHFNTGHGFTFFEEEGVNLNYYLERVSVGRLEYYDGALRLAKAFEKEIGKECTLKKEYD